MRITNRALRFARFAMLAFGILVFFGLNIPTLIVSPTNYVAKSYGIGSADRTNPLRLGVIRLLGIHADRWDTADNSPLVYAVFYRNDSGARELVKKLPCDHLAKAMVRIRVERFQRSGSKVIQDEVVKRCADEDGVQN